MIEILPIKLLRDEDAQTFGSLNVALAKLGRSALPVAPGIVVTSPQLHLKTVLEHYDFGSKEVFQQSLTLVKKELAALPIPEKLQSELKSHKEFFVNKHLVDSIKNVWMVLLEGWIEEIKERLWRGGFSQGVTENLETQIIIFVKKIDSFGTLSCEGEKTYLEVTSGKVDPAIRKKLSELVRKANKKLFIPHAYEWVVDGGVELTKVLPFTPVFNQRVSQTPEVSILTPGIALQKSVVKIFYNLSEAKISSSAYDLSNNFVIEPNIDGIYIASEKIFDLNKPRESFEELVFRIVEAATTFPNSPILVKLADKSEGMGGVRGTLRLIHQQSLLDPLIAALDFARHKKGLTNVHIVFPFVRSPKELSQIKRDLAVKKLMRKNSLQQWLEIAVPENIVNLEEYLTLGVDGVVLNLNELAAYFGGYDHTQEELLFYNHEVIASFAYKNEVGLIKFLEDGLKLLHKSKIKFIATGSLSLHPQVLDFLVEKGVHGVVVEKYEAHSAHDLLHQVEKRLVTRRSI